MDLRNGKVLERTCDLHLSQTGAGRDAAGVGLLREEAKH